MSFIKVQKLKKDDAGSILSGSASIVDTFYDKNKSSYHSTQKVRERLGKVLFLSENKRLGIFMSPTRGLIGYDADSDAFFDVSNNDPRLTKNLPSKEPVIHTVFGDSYLLLRFLEKEGLLSVLRSVFQTKPDFQRLIGHIFHSLLKDGSKINARDFIDKSYLSYLLDKVNFETLKSDTAFFTKMGEDQARMAFFQSHVRHMRHTFPNFGRGCYVDSTPLPNAVHNNPFNALCSHGVKGGTSVQTRLVLVLDEETGLPVWYDLVAGNILDLSTTMNVINDVAVSLDIEIHSLVLDAGYVSRELIQAFHIGTPKTIIGRMPARRGFPFKQLYWDVKPLISRGKYAFVRNEHTYFGKRKEITIFDQPIFAYVYVDQDNALDGLRAYIRENEEEYQSLKDKDKDWLTVKNGFFVLLSNKEVSPQELLTEYFERTQIETVFKAAKTYLQLLPLSKWSETTIRGKILQDLISTIILLQLRKRIDTTGYSTSEIFGRTQSLMCYRDKDDIFVETPNKLTKRFYELLGIPVPAHISLSMEMKRFEQEAL